MRSSRKPTARRSFTACAWRCGERSSRRWQGTFTEPGGVPYEILMLGGDDLLLACRVTGHSILRHYAAELTRHTLADGQPLTVAIGIAIAQKSYPAGCMSWLRNWPPAPAAPIAHYPMTRSLQSSTGRSSPNPGLPMSPRHDARPSTHSVSGRQSDRHPVADRGRPYRVLGAEGLDELLRDAQQLDAPRNPDESGDLEDEDKRLARRTALRAACGRGA
ncbi:MAG: hypothetical protein MZV64_10055 [Ignavibacteriales bacterium]|nr:hypothetical protein [Ignavibacteriales bacterium]